MPGVGFFGMLIIGILAGYIAEKVTAIDQGPLTNLLVGIAGSRRLARQSSEHRVPRLARQSPRGHRRRRPPAVGLAQGQGDRITGDASLFSW